MLFEKLKSFVTIVSKGSYKAAADEIHLSQPAPLTILNPSKHILM